MDNMLNLYEIDALLPTKETVKIAYWGPSEDICREMLYANDKVVVLRIKKIDMLEESISLVSDTLDDLIFESELREDEQAFHENADLTQEQKEELEMRNERVTTGRAEENMSKKCLSCNKKLEYGEIGFVVMSKKSERKNAKIRPVMFCESCKGYLDGGDQLCSLYKEGTGFVTPEEVFN